MQISLEKRLQTRSLEKHIAEEDVLGKAGASKRQLVPRDSDVTMGSEDIPDIFKTPASKKAKAASGLEKAISFFLQAGFPAEAREQAACSHGL